MAEQDYEGIGSQRYRINWPDTLVNTRAPEQFAQIIKAIDLRGSDVCDLGAGHGELAWALQYIGARVECIDSDPALVAEMMERGLLAHEAYIEEYVKNWPFFDVVVLFSVLPYLYNPQMLMQRLRFRANILLLECQYSGDGPGPKYLPDDAAMQRWLTRLDWIPHKIGQTFIQGRDTYRSIWMCTPDWRYDRGTESA